MKGGSRLGGGISSLGSSSLGGRVPSQMRITESELGSVFGSKSIMSATALMERTGGDVEMLRDIFVHKFREQLKIIKAVYKT